MFCDAITSRKSPFRIPVFICGERSDFDGRIVVLRKADKNNKIVQFHSDIRSDKISILKKIQMQQCFFMIRKKRFK